MVVWERAVFLSLSLSLVMGDDGSWKEGKEHTEGEREVQTRSGTSENAMAAYLCYTNPPRRGTALPSAFPGPLPYGPSPFPRDAVASQRRTPPSPKYGYLHGCMYVSRRRPLVAVAVPLLRALQPWWATAYRAPRAVRDGSRLVLQGPRASLLRAFHALSPTRKRV